MSSLDPLASCAVYVVFQPAPESVGSRNAILPVTDTGPSGVAAEVRLVGIVVPPLSP